MTTSENGANPIGAMKVASLKQNTFEQQVLGAEGGDAAEPL